jgi:hypothetical protein
MRLGSLDTSTMLDNIWECWTTMFRQERARKKRRQDKKDIGKRKPSRF